jgi:hypothetical protein
MGEDWVRLFKMQLQAEWSSVGTDAAALLVQFHAMNWPPLLHAFTSDYILQRQNTGRQSESRNPILRVTSDESS